MGNAPEHRQGQGKGQGQGQGKGQGRGNGQGQGMGKNRAPLTALQKLQSVIMYLGMMMLCAMATYWAVILGKKKTEKNQTDRFA